MSCYAYHMQLRSLPLKALAGLFGLTWLAAQLSVKRHTHHLNSVRKLGWHATESVAPTLGHLDLAGSGRSALLQREPINLCKKFDSVRNERCVPFRSC